MSENVGKYIGKERIKIGWGARMGKMDGIDQL